MCGRAGFADTTADTRRRPGATPLGATRPPTAPFSSGFSAQPAARLTALLVHALTIADDLHLALDWRHLQIAVRDNRPVAEGRPHTAVPGDRWYGLLIVQGSPWLGCDPLLRRRQDRLGAARRRAADLTRSTSSRLSAVPDPPHAGHRGPAARGDPPFRVPCTSPAGPGRSCRRENRCR